MVHIGVITYLLTFTNFLGHPTALIAWEIFFFSRNFMCVSKSYHPNPKPNDFAKIPETSPNLLKWQKFLHEPLVKRPGVQGYEILDKPNHLFQKSKTSPFLVKMEPPTPFSYTMESYFQDDFWPYILKNWPMDAERKKTLKAGGGSKNKQTSHRP